MAECLSLRSRGGRPGLLTERKTPVTHASIDKQLKRLGKRAGIPKHITPHIFRHSRITHLIQEGVSESVSKLMMWGNITTDMFSTYAHLTGQDIDNEILSTYGIQVKENSKERRLEPRQCQHCYHINAPDSDYCNRCGLSLTEEVKATQQTMEKSVSENPETLQDLINRVIEEKKARGEI